VPDGRMRLQPSHPDVKDEVDYHRPIILELGKRMTGVECSWYRMEFLLRSAAALWVALWFGASLGAAAEINVDPSNYRALLPKLKPGDTLYLQAGTYARLLIMNLNGTPEAWITITGPRSETAVIAGDSGHNTIEILNSSYVAIKNLRIDSRHIACVRNQCQRW